MNLFWGLAISLSQSRPVALRETSNFFWLGQGKLYGVPVPFVILLIAAAIGQLVLRKSIWGRHVLAVGTNKEAARYAGVRVKWVLLSVMMLQGMLAGLARSLRSTVSVVRSQWAA
jgi:ribose/xylose/arabinose/galactoside ABC-type transport system permease subunit